MPDGRVAAALERIARCMEADERRKRQPSTGDSEPTRIIAMYNTLLPQEKKAVDRLIESLAKGEHIP